MIKENYKYVMFFYCVNWYFVTLLLHSKVKRKSLWYTRYLEIPKCYNYNEDGTMNFKATVFRVDT